MRDNGTKVIEVKGELDIVAARMEVRKLARKLGFSTDCQARVTMATSSLAHFLDLGGKREGQIQITLENGETSPPCVRVTCVVYCTGNRCAVNVDMLNKLRWMVDDVLIESHSSKDLYVTLVKAAA